MGHATCEGWADTGGRGGACKGSHLSLQWSSLWATKRVNGGARVQGQPSEPSVEFPMGRETCERGGPTWEGGPLMMGDVDGRAARRVRGVGRHGRGGPLMMGDVDGDDDNDDDEEEEEEGGGEGGGRERGEETRGTVTSKRGPKSTGWLARSKGPHTAIEGANKPHEHKTDADSPLGQNDDFPPVNRQEFLLKWFVGPTAILQFVS